MSELEKNPSSTIKIVDRRRFDARGEARPEAASIQDPAKPPPPPPAAAPTKAAGAGAAPAKDPSGAAAAAPRPAQAGPSDFLQFIAQLATTAMASMGVLPQAQARGMQVNLQMAKDYLDIIAMLQTRTQGNLSAEEDSTLTRILADLRMQFVELTQGPPQVPPGMPPGMPPPPGMR